MGFDTMVVMGIDGSTSSSGWAIFESNECKRLASGRIQPKGLDWREKIKQEWIIFSQIIEKYKPEKIFMEDVPMKDGKPTIMKLGAVQGMAICLSSQYNIEIVFLLPSEWRSGMGLYDGTRQGTHRDILKRKAVETANKLFDLNLLWIKEKSKKNEDDEAEALLIAYSQIKQSKFGRPKSQ